MAFQQQLHGIPKAPTWFSGNPDAWGPMTQAYGAQVGANAAVQQAKQQAGASKVGAQAGILSTLYDQPGQFAGAIAGAANAGSGAYAAGAQGMGQAAQGMGLAAQGMGNLGQGYGATAQAIGNEKSNWYGANAMAESARQAGLANQGAAALGAYGNASNSAMNSHAMMTTGYMKALTDMMAANQANIGGLGVANQSAVGALGAAGQNALSGLGQATQGAAGQIGAAGQGAAGKVGSADMVTNAMGGLFGGDGGFQATGVNGPIASGSYTNGGNNSSFQFSSSSNAAGREMPRDMQRESLADLSSRDAAYRQQLGLADLSQRDQLERGHTQNLNAASAGDQNYRNQLAQGFYSQINQPRSMLGETLQGVNQLYGSGAGNMHAGMNQFYGAQLNPANWGQYGGVLDGLGGLGQRISDISSGIGGVAGSIGTMARQGGNQAKDAINSISGLWNRSLGQTGAFGGEGPLAHWLTGRQQPINGHMRIG